MRFAAATIACLTVNFLSASIPASAQQTADCGNLHTQLEINLCAERAWQAADAELNDAYKAAMAEMHRIDGYLEPNQRGAANALRDAQRSWISYRDKACEAYGFMARGGSLEPTLIYSCREELTRKRTGELNELAAGLDQ